ncbi:MAG: M1 family metallopeptidase [Myxococcota bacterium]|nr:M1 family metallopeptidase [Myxococcota bacterium]
MKSWPQDSTSDVGLRTPLRCLGLALTLVVQGCALMNTTMDRITSVERYDGKTELDAHVTPVHYTVKLAVDPNQDTFAGRVIMTLSLAKRTRHIKLHGGELDVQSVVVEQTGFVSNGEALPGPNGGLLIRTPEALAIGDVVVTIRYRGQMRQNAPGLFRFDVGRQRFAMTQIKSGEARRVFPCMDRSRFKAPIKLYLTIPTSYTAVTNEREVERRTRDGQNEIQFAESAPMAPDMLMFTVGRFQITSAPKNADYPRIRVMTTPGKGALTGQLVDTIKSVIGELRSFFGQNIDDKIDVLALPELGVPMLSAPGLFAIQENSVLRLPSDESKARRRWLTRTLIKELSRRWIGHAVSAESHEDFWLYEGFTLWIREKLAPLGSDPAASASALIPWLINRELVESPRQIKPGAIGYDSAPRRMTKLDIGKVYALLSMVENRVGLNHIQAALRTIIREKQHQAVSAAEILSAISRSGHLDASQLTKWYLKQAGLPLVRMNLQCRDNTIEVHLSQERARVPVRGEAQGNPWTVPVCIRYGDETNTNTQCHLLTTRTAVMTLPAKTCPKVLFGNVDNQGLYLWTTNLSLIQKSVDLNSQLSNLERRALPHHLLSLLLIDEIDAGSYSKLLSALSEKAPANLVHAVLDSLDMVRRVAASANRTSEFRSWLFGTVVKGGTLTEWLKTPRVQRRVRLVFMGRPTDPDPELKAKALTLLKSPFETSTQTLANTLILAASHGDAQLWETLSKKLQEKPNQPVIEHAYGGALGAFKDSRLFENTLNLAKTEAFSPRALDAMARSIHVENRDQAWAWLMTHHRQLNQRQDGLALKLGSLMIRHFCEDDRLADFKRLVGHAGHAAGKNRNLIRIARRNVEQCVQLSSLLEPTLIRFLGKKSTD